MGSGVIVRFSSVSIEQNQFAPLLCSLYAPNVRFIYILYIDERVYVCRPSRASRTVKCARAPPAEPAAENLHTNGKKEQVVAAAAAA